MGDDLRIVFMGSPPFADKALAALISAGHNIVGVVSAPAGRYGRGRQRSENSIVRMALENNLVSLQPQSAKSEEFKEQFKALNCDLAVVVSYGQILDSEFLALPKLGCVNVHASLLPRWRGASPIQSAIKAGDELSGVCIQKMVLRLDAGDVLVSSEIPLDSESTSPWLFNTCAAKGAELLCQFIEQVNADKQLPEGVKQDERFASHCGKVKKSDGELDWAHSAKEVYQQIRASLGWPGAVSSLPAGDNLKILAAQLCANSNIRGQAGEVIIGEEFELYVCCQEGAIELVEVQRSGKPKTNAKDFINGNNISAGQILGVN
ncbi:MAG: methionyl-tRNA formyltransferase [Planctomycetes bacterium]|nr:methionyl-tRNA formyltransferase [Planctomycetota bacterium]